MLSKKALINMMTKASKLRTLGLKRSVSFSDSSEKMASKADPPYTELERDFLDPAEFYKYLSEKGISFYAGVPDSLLKDFCAYVTDNTPAKNHVITANEGTAIALASGYHLATGKYPLVYLQNSGLGNIVNPIMSLAHSQVYSIPMLLLIGWRGEPGKKDEPQHMIQGKTMNGILTEMGIQYEVLPDYIEGAEKAVDTAIYHMRNRSSPYALIVRRQCFVHYDIKTEIPNSYKMSREEAIQHVVNNLGDHDVVVGTTGFLSRELYEVRAKNKEGHEKDFLCVGSMGHASSIALGIAIAKPSRKVFCLDGDGAALMHLGSMSNIGCSKVDNYKHILFNNGCHDSVGAQPSLGFDVNFPQMALSCGYKQALSVDNEKDLKQAMETLDKVKGPTFLEIKIKHGARKNLGRPKTSPQQNKNKFMEFLNV